MSRLRSPVTGLALLLISVQPVRAQRHPEIDSAVARQLRSAAMPEIEILAAAAEGPGGRFVVTAARSRELSGAAVTAHACAADSTAAAITVRCVVLPTPRVEANLFAFAGDTVRQTVRDFTGDGRADAVIVLSYTGPPEPAVGSTAYSKAYAVVFEPAPRVILTIDVALDPGASAIPHRTGRLFVEDVNGDGHVDLVVRGQNCQAEPNAEDARCRDYERRWLYRPAARTWAPAAARR